jgi:hypothetical protein
MIIFIKEVIFSKKKSQLIYSGNVVTAHNRKRTSAVEIYESDILGYSHRIASHMVERISILFLSKYRIESNRGSN